MRNVTYNWDNAGNRQNVVENNVQTDYVTNVLNQYTSVGGSAVSYIIPAPSPSPTPNQHRITSYQAMTYKYYGDMYLSSVTGGGNTYALFYDALGRCVERKLTVPINGVSTTTTSYYLYDGEHWVVEYDSTGSFKSNALYGRGVDEIIARGVSGQAQFPLPDRNGNTAVVTTTMSNGVATILEQYRYDAFGMPTFKGANNIDLTVQASAIGNRFLFTGREYNSQFGFYEYRARAYHPGLGRFMSEDPKGFDAGDYNLYRYCENDPWDLSDPMGLDSGPYADVNSAYRYFNATYNPYSIQHNVEMREQVYRTAQGQIMANTPLVGSSHKVGMGQIPEGAHLAGDIHSHGQYSHGFGDQNGKIIRIVPIGSSPYNSALHLADNMRSNHPSSPQDYNVWKSEAKGNPGFTGAVAGPAKQISVYDSQSGKTTVIPSQPVVVPVKIEIFQMVTGSNIPQKVGR